MGERLEQLQQTAFDAGLLAYAVMHLVYEGWQPMDATAEGWFDKATWPRPGEVALLIREPS